MNCRPSRRRGLVGCRKYCPEGHFWRSPPATGSSGPGAASRAENIPRRQKRQKDLERALGRAKEIPASCPCTVLPCPLRQEAYCHHVDLHSIRAQWLRPSPASTSSNSEERRAVIHKRRAKAKRRLRGEREEENMCKGI